jgi:3-hydroxybutyryl-CoA dehydrogenase
MQGIERVAVIGAGTMGHGIAQVAAMAGCEVWLTDARPEALGAAVAKVTDNLEKGVARGKVDAAAAAAALGRLRTGTLAEGVREADLVIEAVPEQLALKQQLFREAEAAAPAHAILATNTSSLSVARIADAVSDPSRVIGLHFFNPVHIMELLEIVRADRTRDDVLAACRAFGERLGKSCIVVRDMPGFATSRLGVALGMEAIRMLEQGVASAEDIDTAMVLGYRHPVGPLKLTDMVGLDVRLAIGEYLSVELGNDAFRPPALMREMVARGDLGKKAGQGFYRW